MNEKDFADKRISLGFEFQRYLITHPEMAEEVPKEAQIFFILEDDPEFTRAEKHLAEKVKEEGAKIIFVKVEKIIPPFESRLVNPRIVVSPYF